MEGPRVVAALECSESLTAVGLGCDALLQHKFKFKGIIMHRILLTLNAAAFRSEHWRFILSHLLLLNQTPTYRLFGL